MTISRRFGIVVLSILLPLVACSDNANPFDPNAPQCSNGIDDDGDGDIDFPDDLGCTSAADDSEDSPTSPQCKDGRDNDGDGLIDFPYDPGCFVDLQDSEEDDCPDGPGCPQCSDGVDNDGNGLIDFPNDPGCESAGDPLEFLNNPTACGTSLMIKQLPPNGEVMGMLDGSSTSTIQSPCGGGGGASAWAYVMLLTEPKVIVASTDDPTTTADTVIDIRSQMCSNPESHVACSNDVSASNPRSRVTQSLPAGIYYIIVQGYSSSTMGSFTLKVQQFTGEGAMCATTDECGPGLVCRKPVNGPSMVCTQPQCSDGLDDDGDGKIDYPIDPGCESPEDNDESNDDCSSCPSCTNCPECGDGIDNDADGAIDYPADTSCVSASGTSESCMQSEAIVKVTSGTTMGTTVGAVNDYRPPCASSITHTAPDVALELDLPAMATINLNLQVTAYDTVHVLLNSSCQNPPIRCSDPTNMTHTNLPAGRYYVIVDGWSTASGPFTLLTSGTVAPGGSCEGALFQSGAFTCAQGLTCDGPAGARTCRSECSDGIDNNMDGRIDYPNDPGCESAADPTENTVCPGPMCPACFNGIDDDADGLLDYLGDPACIAAGFTSEVACAIDPDYRGVITQQVTMGTLAAPAANNFTSQSCQSLTGNDVVYELSLPVPVASLQIDTSASTTITGGATDTVLSLRDVQCNVELACDDDGSPTSSFLSQIVRPNVPAGTYAIIVDSYGSSQNRPFALTVRGTVAPQTTCTSPLFAAGVLACPTGTTCTAGVCQ